MQRILTPDSPRRCYVARVKSASDTASAHLSDAQSPCKPRSARCRQTREYPGQSGLESMGPVCPRLCGLQCAVPGDYLVDDPGNQGPFSEWECCSVRDWRDHTLLRCSVFQSRHRPV